MHLHGWRNSQVFGAKFFDWISLEIHLHFATLQTSCSRGNQQFFPIVHTTRMIECQLYDLIW